MSLSCTLSPHPLSLVASLSLSLYPQVIQIRAGALLGFTELQEPSVYAQQMFCAAKLAEIHVNQHNGIVVSQLGTLSSRIRLSLMPFDTNSTPSGGVVALNAALKRRCDVLVGPLRSSVSIAVAARSQGMPQV